MTKKEITSADLYRYFSGHSNDQEIEGIMNWLDKNYAHQQEFILQKKVFIESGIGMTDELKETEVAFERFLEQVALREQFIPKAEPKLSVFKSFFRYAASVIVIVSIATAAFLWGTLNPANVSSEEYYEIEVPYGSKTSLKLPDNSKVILNAGSKLRYNRDFGQSSREIFLEGEAFFEVEKHRHPMVVNTSHIAVRVLGTVFNIKSYPEEQFIETTLLEGSIVMESILEPHLSGIHMKANDKLVFNKNSGRLIEERALATDNDSDSISEQVYYEPVVPFRLSRNVDVTSYVSWTDGKYTFQGESLENLAVILSRKFDVTFSFESEDVKKYTYSGTIGDFPIEQVLDALKLTSPILYEIKEKSVFLTLDDKSAATYKGVMKR